MQLREKCNNIMKCKTLPNGEVVLTNVCNLSSKYIIQTVGPQVDGMPSEKDEDDLRKCYYNSLELCKDKGLKTIAFPCIATGLYVKEYLKVNPITFNYIIFNVYKDEDFEIYKKNI